MKPKATLHGRYIRGEERTVIDIRAVREIAHRLRYGPTPVADEDMMFIAGALDILANLVSARQVYGAKVGDEHVREVLALMGAFDGEER